MPSILEQIESLTKRTRELDEEKTALLTEIVNLQETLQKQECFPSDLRVVAESSFSPQEKISIFRSLFRGRADVFPKRWGNQKTGKSGYSPACHNEWVRGVCKKPHIKCGDCLHQAFIPPSEEVVRKHLTGDNSEFCKRDNTIGVYPLLKDETCWFLAVDFDKEHWKRDVAAYLNTCKRRHVPASLERSRSGNGAHVWIFFSEPIAASDARKMGAALLTETMESSPELGFESYDRFSLIRIRCLRVDSVI